MIRSHANFIIIFLPKALHYNSKDNDETEKKTPIELYDEEQLRIDKLELEENNTQPIIHIKILQKRFDINDKQISAVGILTHEGYTRSAYDTQN